MFVLSIAGVIINLDLMSGIYVEQNQIKCFESGTEDYSDFTIYEGLNKENAEEVFKKLQDKLNVVKL